ncbi:hypothetical protein DS901_06705 [Loktanella sp. D2R18]|uniref:hypothetical protein n=1 Tax=Rhodobacterales TaxID=204455 RepID=UPI000DEB35DD|nr:MULTISPECIES: hypothetical protein [Rhodobacterales]MDO6589460.1 hypothetical protein [Yoonia sp. 1_MG-2023]RBW44111.1 hypothetical protein DS901_06705 [Loktanella sp. D2R18]
MLGYLTGGLAAVAVASLGYAGVLRADRVALQQDVVSLQLQLSACGGRLQTILDDKGSDHAVDQMPDTDLIAVPDHWLRP